MPKCKIFAKIKLYTHIAILIIHYIYSIDRRTNFKNMQNFSWQQFGLKKDPYDTAPLVEGGDLAIEKAFVGREQEKKFLNSLFESSEKLCLTICGDVGVGKTSLSNFHKFIWKNCEQKMLFSFRREIEACEYLLDKKNFLIEIIGSVLREIKLVEPKLLKDATLTKLNQIVDISQSIAISGGASIYGAGLNFGRDKTPILPIQLSVAILEEYFFALLDFIRSNEINGKKYSGLIVHVNNFDIVIKEENTKRKVINFFNEIRNLLQTQNVYFLFLGPKNFFKDIISTQQRVKSIFCQIPLQVKPLSKKEIVEAFDERMLLLQSSDVSKYIKPIEDEVVFRLYDLYQGDIRKIMIALSAILNQCSDKLVKTLSIDESMLLLGEERWNQMNMAIKLTDEQKIILRYLIDKDKISQKEVITIFKKAQSNVSGYYFKPLRDAGIIEEKEKIGKIPYWGLTGDYVPLKWVVKSQKRITQDINDKSGQLAIV